MTRINVVPVEELCDQHLLAEWRELTRVPNELLKGKLNGFAPLRYTVRTNDNPAGGKGHMTFFKKRLGFLHVRYLSILDELAKRDLPQKNYWSEATFKLDKVYWGNYTPTEDAMTLNRKRIKEQWPKNARYYRKPMEIKLCMCVQCHTAI